MRQSAVASTDGEYYIYTEHWEWVGSERTRQLRAKCDTWLKKRPLFAASLLQSERVRIFGGTVVGVVGAPIAAQDYWHWRIVLERYSMDQLTSGGSRIAAPAVASAVAPKVASSTSASYVYSPANSGSALGRLMSKAARSAGVTSPLQLATSPQPRSPQPTASDELQRAALGYSAAAPPPPQPLARDPRWLHLESQWGALDNMSTDWVQEEKKQTQHWHNFWACRTVGNEVEARMISASSGNADHARLFRERVELRQTEEKLRESLRAAYTTNDLQFVSTAAKELAIVEAKRNKVEDTIRRCLVEGAALPTATVGSDEAALGGSETTEAALKRLMAIKPKTLFHMLSAWADCDQSFGEEGFVLGMCTVAGAEANVDAAHIFHKLFAICDENGDGRLDYDELIGGIQFLERFLHDPIQAASARAAAPSLAGADGGAGGSAGVSSWSRLMALTSLKPKDIYRGFAPLLNEEGDLTADMFVQGIAAILQLSLGEEDNDVKADAQLLFEAFDIDDSGGLNLAEVRVGLKHLEMKRSRSAWENGTGSTSLNDSFESGEVNLVKLGALSRMGADVVWAGLSRHLDASGEVDPSNFVVAMAGLAGIPAEDRATRDVIHRLFEIFDADESGGISSDEVVEGLKYVSNWISSTGAIDLRGAVEMEPDVVAMREEVDEEDGSSPAGVDEDESGFATMIEEEMESLPDGGEGEEEGAAPPPPSKTKKSKSKAPPPPVASPAEDGGDAAAPPPPAKGKRKEKSKAPPPPAPEEGGEEQQEAGSSPSPLKGKAKGKSAPPPPPPEGADAAVAANGGAPPPPPAAEDAAAPPPAAKAKAQATGTRAPPPPPQSEGNAASPAEEVAAEEAPAETGEAEEPAPSEAAPAEAGTAPAEAEAAPAEADGAPPPSAKKKKKKAKAGPPPPP